MTINLETYKRARAVGIPAKHAASLASATYPDLDWHTDSRGREVAEFERDGFDIRVTAESDYDMSDEDLGYGRWVWAERYAEYPERRPEPDAIPVPYNQHTEAKWYVAAESMANMADYYHKHGASKSVALDMARKQAEDELENALGNGYGPDVRIVTVRVSKAGVELGRSSVGGVEIAWNDITRTDGTEYLAECAMDILPEAMNEARENIAAIIEREQAKIDALREVV